MPLARASRLDGVRTGRRRGRRSELRLPHRPRRSPAARACRSSGRTTTGHVRDGHRRGEAAGRRRPAPRARRLARGRRHRRRSRSRRSRRATGRRVVLRNNGDGTFAVARPVRRRVARCAASRGPISTARVCPTRRSSTTGGAPRVPQPARRRFREREVPAAVPAGGGHRRGGRHRRRDPRRARCRAPTAASPGFRATRAVRGFEAARIAQVDPPPGLAPGTARLLVADLDNNGAADLVISASGHGSRAARRGRRSASAPIAGTLPGGIAAAADLDGDGRLELVGRERRRRARRPGERDRRRITGRRSGRAPRPRPAISASTRSASAARSRCAPACTCRSRSSPPPVVHFGLGEATAAEVARITWPNGVAAVGVRLGGRRQRSARASGSRDRARGCSPGTAARWASSPTSSGDRRSACASTRRRPPTC